MVNLPFWICVKRLWICRNIRWTGLPDKPIAPFVYSTRDLFRPGETMDLSVLLRDRDGKAVPGKNLHLRIVRPDTKPLLEENLLASQ